MWDPKMCGGSALPAHDITTQCFRPAKPTDEEGPAQPWGSYMFVAMQLQQYMLAMVRGPCASFVSLA